MTKATKNPGEPVNPKATPKGQAAWKARRAEAKAKARAAFEADAPARAEREAAAAAIVRKRASEL